MARLALDKGPSWSILTWSHLLGNLSRFPLIPANSNSTSTTDKTSGRTTVTTRTCRQFCSWRPLHPNELAVDAERTCIRAKLCNAGVALHLICTFRICGASAPAFSAALHWRCAVGSMRGLQLSQWMNTMT